jgi:restriction endonuclease Mrr
MKTGGPNDKGCDAIAIKDEVYSHYRYCIQIKRYSKTTRVGINDIREVIDGIDIYKCDRGLIITTSSFSPEAISRAKSKNTGLSFSSFLRKLVTDILLESNYLIPY